MCGKFFLLCALVFTCIISPVCRAEKKGPWWIFPNFDNDLAENSLPDISSMQRTDLDARNGTVNDLRSQPNEFKLNGVYRNDRDIKNLIGDGEVVETVLINNSRDGDKKDNGHSTLQSDSGWKKVNDGNRETISTEDESPILYQELDAKVKPGPVSRTPGGQGREISKTEESSAKGKGAGKTAPKDLNRLRNNFNDDDDGEAVVEGSGSHEDSEESQQKTQTSARKNDREPSELLEEIEGSGDVGNLDAKPRNPNTEKVRIVESDDEATDDAKEDDFEFEGEDGKSDDIKESSDEEGNLSYSEDGEERDSTQSLETDNVETEDSNDFNPTIVPVFPTDSAIACDKMPNSYRLEIKSESDAFRNGSSINLECHFHVDTNDISTEAPNFQLNWIFQGLNCSKGHKSDECWIVLSNRTFTFWDATFTTLDIPNAQHINSGNYVCEVVFECQNPHGDWITSTIFKSIKVYEKPLYEAQMTVILSICFMLLAILIGMSVYANKKRKRVQAKYDAMTASHKIQIASAKVLDLPQHTVYMPTTTSIEPVNNGSLLSSKSSFSSLSNREDV